MLTRCRSSLLRHVEESFVSNNEANRSQDEKTAVASLFSSPVTELRFLVRSNSTVVNVAVRRNLCHPTEERVE